MSEKHTPGPWFVDTDGDQTIDTHWGVVSKHNDLWVAACYRSGTTPRDEKSPEADAEAKANAALIARAPTLAAEVEALRAENDKLRAKLGNSPEPCAYCALPADKLLDCHMGFPGCPRADDMMLCGHFGAAMEAAGLRADLDAERRKVEALEKDAARWQPIETADSNALALLYAPPEALFVEPAKHLGEFRVAAPRNWTWATHWMPLPAPPAIDAALAAEQKP